MVRSGVEPFSHYTYHWIRNAKIATRHKIRTVLSGKNVKHIYREVYFGEISSFKLTNGSVGTGFKN